MDIGADWEKYEYSSIAAYTEGIESDWIHTKHFVENAAERMRYKRFMRDYTDMHQTLALIKAELAG